MGGGGGGGEGGRGRRGGGRKEGGRREVGKEKGRRERLGGSKEGEEGKQKVFVADDNKLFNNKSTHNMYPSTTRVQAVPAHSCDHQHNDFNKCP